MRLEREDLRFTCELENNDFVPPLEDGISNSTVQWICMINIWFQGNVSKRLVLYVQKETKNCWALLEVHKCNAYKYCIVGLISRRDGGLNYNVMVTEIFEGTIQICQALEMEWKNKSPPPFLNALEGFVGGVESWNCWEDRGNKRKDYWTTDWSLRDFPRRLRA